MDALHYCGWLGGVSYPVMGDTDRDWRMYTFVRDGNRGVASMYVNGQLLQSSDGDIGELLVYNGALADAERIQLEGRLARRFRLSHRLPSIHPF